MHFVYQRKKVLAYWAGYLVFMIFFFYFDKRKLFRDSVFTKGVVVEVYHQGKNALNRVGYDYPLYQFSYQGNFYYSSEERIFVRNKNVGDSVIIIFPKGNPNQSQSYSLFTYWFNGIELIYSFIMAFAIFAIPRVVESVYNDFLKK